LPGYPQTGGSSRPCSGLRSENLFSKSRGAVIEAPEEIYAPTPSSRRARRSEPRFDSARPRDLPGSRDMDDFAGSLPDPVDDGFDTRRQQGGYRIRFRGRILQVPRTLGGRIAAGIGFFFVAGCLAGALFALRSFFLHDSRFVVASSSAIQITGNTHLSRAQLLSVFGEDVERNIFNVPLVGRRAELEQLPWVAHATVMRLLPNHLRIAVTERTPVAFVRQGTQIGMVDANGVLLDIPPDAPGDPQYSFPVVTGISQSDPHSTRAARMQIYGAFTTDLDSTGGHISQQLSEVDLSNPEDVKALIPEGSAEVLVHFGESDFLSRYQKFEQHLPEWRTQYPKLASVDMRYERQVVLEMQPGAAVPAAAPVAGKEATAATPKPAAKPAPAKAAATKPAAPATAHAAIKKAALKPSVKPAAKTAGTGKPTKTSPATTSDEWHMVVVKPHTKAKAPDHPGNGVKQAQPTHAAHPFEAAPQ
jgi:cell division protein FtsQ